MRGDHGDQNSKYGVRSPRWDRQTVTMQDYGDQPPVWAPPLNVVFIPSGLGLGEVTSTKRVLESEKNILSG